MKKLLHLLFLLLPLGSMAQDALSPKAEKQLDAAINLYEKGYRQKGMEMAREVLEESPTIRPLWDLLAKMHKQDLEIAQANFNNSLGRSLEDLLKDLDKKKKNGKKSDPKASKSMEDALGPYLISKLAYDNYLREATLKSRSTLASMYLRNDKVDGDEPDSLVNTKARETFQKADELFMTGNYEASLPLYREAMTQANGPYYTAELYLGDAYFMLAEYDSAEKYFKACTIKYPQYIEPHKYLADTYVKKYEFEKAIEACSEAISIYPDASMFLKLEECAKYLRKHYTDGWIPREYYPYGFTGEQYIGTVETAAAKAAAEEDEKAAKMTAQARPTRAEYWRMWNDYRSLSASVWPNCDSLGIFQNPEPYGNETYAEVYVWKKLLENHPDNLSLLHAREMDKKGYLDCYVFITLFHYDLYPTYKHFIANHKQKAATYLRDVVIYK